MRDLDIKKVGCFFVVAVSMVLFIVVMSMILSEVIKHYNQ